MVPYSAINPMKNVYLKSSQTVENLFLDQQVTVTGEVPIGTGSGGMDYNIGYGLAISGDNMLIVDTDSILGREDQSCKALGENSRALGENSIAYTANSIVEGENSTAGTNSFRIISGDSEARTLKLKTTAGLKPGMLCSLRLLNNYDLAGTIISV